MKIINIFDEENYAQIPPEFTGPVALGFGKPRAEALGSVNAVEYYGAGTSTIPDDLPKKFHNKRAVKLTNGRWYLA